jgi:hypothetical protein
MFRRREARIERTREEVLLWANPILNSVLGLKSRLENILKDNLHVALSPSSAGVDRPVNPDWSISYAFVMPSTLFFFAEYFAWVQLLRERVSLELFESQDSHKRFSNATWEVTKALGDWPIERDVVENRRVFTREGAGETKASSTQEDAQVFALQQRAIGELLIERDTEPPRVLTYRAFVDAFHSDALYASLFEPLRSLLRDLEPETKRWTRLECTFTALTALEHECRTLLSVHPDHDT